MILLRETASTLSQNLFENEEIVRIPYSVDYLVAVLPNAHPLAKCTTISLRELQDEEFCFIKEGSFMYDICRLSCQEAGISPNVVYSSHRLDNIFDMVTRGSCVALMMNKHAEHPIDSDLSNNPPFSTVKISPAITSQVSLCCLKDSHLSNSARLINWFCH